MVLVPKTGSAAGFSRPPPRPRAHRVSIAVEGKEIDDWTEYQIDQSLVEPADSFSLTRPFRRDAWDLCPRDARVRVLIDGQPRIAGIVDDRNKRSSAGTMTISGRCYVGRLVQESAPRSAYRGQTLLEVLRALARPFFEDVVLSNAKNRKVLLGKGSKVPRDGQAIALLKGRRTGKAVDPITAMFAKPAKKQNRIDPGRMRWDVISDLLSRAGLAAWSSADGKTLFVGRPDQDQPSTFLFRHSTRGQSNIIDLDYTESNADRYSMITSLGSGPSNKADYGEAACSRAGVVYDYAANHVDGTGRDFKIPKRLILAESGVVDRAEAQRLAARKRDQLDFDRIKATVTCWHHGQDVDGASVRTLFAPDTMAHLIDEDIDMAADFLVYAISLRASASQSETTELQLVPRHTEVLP
jgi:prophage tail gpP-like protein